MPVRDVVVVGASAGGVEALKLFVQRLPSDLPSAIFVVLHVSPHGTSYLPTILNRSSSLPVEFARHQAPIQPGRVYVDYRLAIDGIVSLLISQAGPAGLASGQHSWSANGHEDCTAVPDDANDSRPNRAPNARLTDLTCPECGGRLRELEERGLTRY